LIDSRTTPRVESGLGTTGRSEEGRITEVLHNRGHFIYNGPVTTTFQYDNGGNVVQKITDGTTTTYVYDYANRLTALGVLGATTTYGYDAFGIGVWQATGSAAPYGTAPTVQWLDYAPYGSVLASENTGPTTAARQYIGQFSDASGLSYLNARYYNGAQGQFTTEDPVFLGGHPNLQDPQSLNAYSYSEDNPIVREDPLGKYFQLSVSGTADDLSGSAGVQFTLFPVAANVVAAGGFGAGLEGSPFSLAYTPGPVPQDSGPTVSVGGDAVYGAGLGVDTSGTYVPSTVSLENQSTSYSFVVGGGADIYLRTIFHFYIRRSHSAGLNIS
jgi:RHS repeat-associated protein